MALELRDNRPRSVDSGWLDASLPRQARQRPAATAQRGGILDAMGRHQPLTWRCKDLR